MFGFSVKQIGIMFGIGIITIVVIGSLTGDGQQAPEALRLTPALTASPSPQLQPTLPTSPTSQTKPPQPQITVTFVVDGDTLELSTGQRVRLIGIDSPESGNPYYSEARNKLIQLALNKEARLEKDITEADRHGRLVRYAYVGDTFVNLEMVKRGYAKVYSYPPDVKYADRFLAAEREAKNDRLGLWAPPPPPSVSSPTTTTIQSTEFSMPVCASSDCDCSDFSIHAHAQWFHDSYDPADKHKLDQDKNGLACESLP